MKRDYKITYLFILICLLFPKIVSAGSVSDVVANGCGTNVNDFPVLKDLRITDNINRLTNCADDTSNQGDYGLYGCVHVDLGQSYSVSVPAGQTGKKGIGYIYITGRIDVWSHHNGNWNNNTTFGTKTCPNMSLVYTSTEALNEYIKNDIKKYKNAKVTAITSGSYETEDSQLYSIKQSNYKVSMVGDGPQLTDSNGNLINDTIKYRTEISSLVANGSSNGLGFNGINKTKCLPDINGNCTNGLVRALHYFTPIKIEIEYDNPDYTPDPCKETINGKTPQQYAYENDNVCCDDFPETCCYNTEYIVSIKDKKPEILGFCCQDIDGDTYYDGNYGVKTFKGYYPSIYYRDFFNEIKPICSKVKCETPEEYYTYEWDGSVMQSSCCKTGKYKDDYAETNCKLPEECSVTNNNCSNNTYFDKNADCCCGINPSDSRCDEKTWNEFDGMSCASTPGTGIVAIGTKNDTNGSMEERVTFTKYKNYTQMKSNVIKAGTGFDYDIKVKHTITKKAENEYNYYDKEYNLEQAVKKAQEEIDKYLSLSNSEYNGIENTSKNFKLESRIKNEYYILDGSIINETKPSDEVENTVYVKYQDICTDTDLFLNFYNYPCEKTYELDYVTEKTYTYTYDLKLRNQFIAKDDASLAVYYDHKTEYDSDDIRTVNTLEPENYLDGGNKIYTELTTNTGIYDFKIKLNEGKSLGATGNLENYEGGFDCQFGVVNQFRKDGKFNCGTTKDLPCPDPDEDSTKIGRGFYFRQISLFDPFPNGRTPGKNWQGNIENDDEYIGESKVSSYITDKNDDVYSGDPMYEITLTPMLIKEITSYNREQNNDYGWTNMESASYNKLDLTSSFITKYFGDTIKVREDLNRAERVGDFR